jgi:signal transduction histidine kinase
VPEFIARFAVGPLLGLAANGAIAILCLVTLSLYRHYRPLRSLFFFYLVLTFCFLGWVIYGLQRSEESILLGNRILYAAIAFLPAIWFWFYLSLFNEKPDWLTCIVTGISFILASLALLGRGPLLFGLPMEPDPIALDVMRPQSKLLKPLIQSFSLMACIFYFIIIILRLWRFKDRRPVYLLPVGIGLFIWFLGGLHDALRVAGVAVLYKDYVLWFTSLWLSIFLTIAVALHFRSLEQAAREELERLSKVKSKALDHLSHELRTPLALVQGNIRLIKRKAQMQSPPSIREEVFESLEKNLDRLSAIQQETDQIIRSYQELETRQRLVESDYSQPSGFELIDLYPFTERILENVKTQAKHRNLHFYLDGQMDLHLLMDSKILEESLVGLLKNAIENTPDEGMVRIVMEQKAQWTLLKFLDFGIGITKENQRHLFDGFFHTLDTELYTSKKPYDFGAGGKGLDLLRMKAYSQQFGFDISVGSQRCIYLPTDRDLCPGKISACPHCKTPEDCLSSGGSTFCVTFPISEKIPTLKD